MPRINYVKVLIGGIAAALVLVAFEMLGGVVLGFDYEAWAASHNLAAEPNVAVGIASMLLLGIMVVWLYAAIRPRFGPGPKTAAIAAAFMWLFFCATHLGQTAIGLYSSAEFMKLMAWGAVQMLATSLVGAWLYKEV